MPQQRAQAMDIPRISIRETPRTTHPAMRMFALTLSIIASKQPVGEKREYSFTERHYTEPVFVQTEPRHLFTFLPSHRLENFLGLAHADAAAEEALEGVVLGPGAAIKFFLDRQFLLIGGPTPCLLHVLLKLLPKKKDVGLRLRWQVAR